MQFGEGGAGTFSDGKLWSQISDPRHLTRKVLDEFVSAGAPEEIRFVAKPHIGTFRLVGVVEKMRARDRALGGEIRFGSASSTCRSKLARARRRDTRRESRGGDADARLAARRSHADHVVLALGHSARDTFAMLHGARRRMRGQAVLDRLSDRASAVA